MRKAGFRVSRRRVHEDNLLFDTPDRALLAAGAALRLRRSGRMAILTYKGPAVVARHKSRLELETTVASASTMESVLFALGFDIVFRYAKYRTEYRRRECSVQATLDETPVGVFVELEGSPSVIDRTAERLGFDVISYITDSYADLYRASHRSVEGRAAATGSCKVPH